MPGYHPTIRTPCKGSSNRLEGYFVGCLCKTMNMHISPIPGVSGDSLLGQLLSAKASLSAVGGGNVQQRFTDYMGWASTQADILGRYLRRDDLNNLITTPRYWTLQGLIPMIESSQGNIGFHGQVSINGLLNPEIAGRNRELEKIIENIQSELSHWKTVEASVVMADTNIYLHQEQEFEKLPWKKIAEADEKGVHLVIPLIVIEELDRQKRNNGRAVSKTNLTPVRSRSRVTLRSINELFKKTIEPGQLKEVDPQAGPVTVSLLLEDPRHVPLQDADGEFLDRARSLKDFISRDVRVITSDSAMEFRARSIGLKTKLLEDN
jgi:hypothetical protein